VSGVLGRSADVIDRTTVEQVRSAVTLAVLDAYGGTLSALGPAG